MTDLRPATPADLPDLYQLDLLCFTEPFRFDLPSMRRYASQPGAIVLLANSADFLIGFILVNMSRRGKISSGYITTLDVHPEHRRQGIALRLLQAAETQATRAGVTRLRLHVSSQNEPAIRFYEQSGFKRQFLTENFYAPNLHALSYSKDLSSPQPS